MSREARERLGDVYELGVIAGLCSVLRERGALARVGPWSPLEATVRETLERLAPSPRPMLWDTTCEAVGSSAHLHGQTIADRWTRAFPRLERASVFAPAERFLGESPDRLAVARSLGLSPESLPEELFGSGQLGHADLAVVAESRGSPHVLVVECSLHLGQGDEHLPDLRSHRSWRSLVEQAAMRQLRQGGFANLRAGVEERVGVAFPVRVRQLYRTLAERQRELSKLYQGCSYARALALSVARERGLPVEVTVVGSTMLGFEHLSATCPAPGAAPSAPWKVLSSCADIYPGLRETSARAPSELGRLWDVRELFQQSMPGSIASLAGHKAPAGSLDLRAEETITHHPRVSEVRQAHALEIGRLIEEARPGELTVGCLVGAPGIGKTTAVRTTLRNLTGGWFLLYASPRIAINGDQRARMAEEDPRAFCLTANARLAEAVTSRHRGARGFAYVSGPDEGLAVVRSREDFETGRGREWLFDASLADEIERTWATSPRESFVRDAADSLRAFDAQRQGVLRGAFAAARHVLEARPGLSHVAVSLTLQALRGAEVESFDPLLTARARFVRHDPSSIAEAERFASRFETVVVMLDEITGEEGSPRSIAAVQRWLRTRLIGPLRAGKAPKVVLLLSDASLATAEAMRQFLSSPNAAARVMTSPVTGGPRAVERVAVTLQLGDHQADRAEATLVRGDAYPASRLTLGYRVVLGLAEALRDDLDTVKELKTRSRQMSEELTTSTVSAALGKTAGQVLCFVQDRSLLDQVRDRLIASKTVTGDEVFVLTSDTSPAERERLREGRDRFKLVLMTSSGTRGVDFPKAQRLLALMRPTAPEHDLMELVQFAWRGRGAGHDELERHIEVVIVDVLDESGDEGVMLRAQKRHVDLVAFALTVRAALHTRIFGSMERPDGGRVAVIPVGRTGGEQGEPHLQQLVSGLDAALSQYGRHPLVSALRARAADFFDHMTYRSGHLSPPPSLEASRTWCEAVRRLDPEREAASGPLLVVRTEVHDRAVFSAREVEGLSDALRKFLGVARGGEFSNHAVSAARKLDHLCSRAREATGYQQLLGRIRPSQIVLPIHARAVDDSLSAEGPGQEGEDEHARWRDALVAWTSLSSRARVTDVGGLSRTYRGSPFVVVYDESDPTGLDDLGSRGIARAGRLANALAGIVLA